jgi:L-threonylcarbamoyladenylate synthase
VSAEATNDAEAFERCMAVGGVALFPADTVYGLACDPGNRVAVERLYLLKRRPLEKPSAVMFFGVELALEALPELGERTRRALRGLLPGGVTLLLPNPARRYPLACGEDPGTLGVRVPNVPRLAGVRWPVLQSSANRAGGPDPRRPDEVPELIRAAADLVIDGGELPGAPSTVVDLRHYEHDGTWLIVRQGAAGEDVLEDALGARGTNMTISISEEPVDAPDSDELLRELNTDLIRRYRGDGHPSVAPSTLEAASFLVARDGAGHPLGCVALRRRDDGSFEIKRMYVRPEARGKGLGDRLLAEVEQRARALGATRVKLETGLAQPEAMALYERNGYEPIEPFGDYRDSPLSRSYARIL